MRVWLSDIRGERSQKKAAELSGITQSYYSMIECGERNPSVELAKKIASVLRFDWTRFFE